MCEAHRTGGAPSLALGMAHCAAEARVEALLRDPLPPSLARQAGVRVRWRLLARSGLTTQQAEEQLQQHPIGPWDVAVVVTGVNDVVDQVPSSRAVAARERIVAMYDERFYRMWTFYLSGAAAAFSARRAASADA